MIIYILLISHNIAIPNKVPGHTICPFQFTKQSKRESLFLKALTIPREYLIFFCQLVHQKIVLPLNHSMFPQE